MYITILNALFLSERALVSGQKIQIKRGARVQRPAHRSRPLLLLLLFLASAEQQHHGQQQQLVQVLAAESGPGQQAHGGGQVRLQRAASGDIIYFTSKIKSLPHTFLEENKFSFLK